MKVYNITDIEFNNNMVMLGITELTTPQWADAHKGGERPRPRQTTIFVTDRCNITITKTEVGDVVATIE